jgi:YidC/Oxa1 family membrane protein insertase
MVLSGAILIVWQMFFAPPPMPPADGEQAGQTTAGTTNLASGATGGATTTGGGGDVATKTPPVATPPKVVAPRADALATNELDVQLSNQGARVTGFEIRSPEQYQKAGDLLGKIPEDSKHFPFAVSFDEGTIAVPADAVYEVVSPKTPDEEADRVVYRWTDPSRRFQVEKVFTAVGDEPNTLRLQVSVTNLTDQPAIGRPHLEITGYADPNQEKSFLDFRPDELEGVCRIEGDTERELHSGLKGKPAETFGSKEQPVVWAGVDTRYFLWAAIPETSKPSSCVLKVVSDDYMSADMVWAPVTIAPKSTYTMINQIYMGQKDLDVFGTIGHELNESVDYGLFTILARPLRWLLNLFHTWLGNWGFAIILLTLLIKIVTWPVLGKTYENSEKMKELQPQLDAIRTKYENDQQRLGEETMKLFAENKFNPLGGCLPMLLQMPILYGLFVMINNSVELYQAEFALWYTDLSAPDPYFVLPLFMGAVMFLQQKWMTPESSSAANQQMQTVMKIMPIMFTAFMLFLPSGLVLYYSLNLVLGVFQQFLIRRKYAAKRAAAA